MKLKSTIKSLLSNNRIVFEFLSVSFAVFLALAANQCRDNYNNNQQASKSLNNIRIELSENKEIIEKLVPEHKKLLAFIDSVIPVFNVESEADDDTASVDISFQILSSTSWQTAKITQIITNMDLDLVSNISKCYQFQAYYEELIKNYIHKNLFSLNDDITLETLKNIQKFLNSVIPMEENLLTYYDTMINKLIDPDKLRK